ncbi:MAG TPA: hypothetical protein VIT18_01265 [Terrimicrobiaceae bacterium]
MNVPTFFFLPFNAGAIMNIPTPRPVCARRLRWTQGLALKASRAAVFPRFIFTILFIAGSGLYAQTSPKDFVAEPDKTMAVGREYLLKGDSGKAAAEIRKAAVFVRKNSLEVAADVKASLEDAARALEKLADDVRSGATKSDAELNRVFAKTDYALATSWNRTAAQAGKGEREEAMKKASSALLGAAKWSTSKLDGSADSPLKAFDGPIPSDEMDVEPATQNVGDQSKRNSAGAPSEARKP